jgi:hypothetical protein
MYKKRVICLPIAEGDLLRGHIILDRDNILEGRHGSVIQHPGPLSGIGA